MKMRIMPPIHALSCSLHFRGISECDSLGCRYRRHPFGIIINYRRITVLPSVAKVLDAMRNNRLVFLTDILVNDDVHNGGCKKGCSATDNLLVLSSIIQRQKALRKPLFTAFIDFRKAFDSVNRTILFYKLMKSGYHGRIITILKSL